MKSEREEGVKILSKEEVREGLLELAKSAAYGKMTLQETGRPAKTLLLRYLTPLKISEIMPPLRLRAAGREVENPIFGIPLRLHEPDKFGVTRCDVLWAKGIGRFPFLNGEIPTLQYTPELEGTLRIPDYYDLPPEEYLETVTFAMDVLEGKAGEEEQTISQTLIEKLEVKKSVEG